MDVWPVTLNAAKGLATTLTLRCTFLKHATLAPHPPLE
jgi:hypothetical protein